MKPCFYPCTDERMCSGCFAGTGCTNSAPTSHPIPTGATGENVRSRVMEVITGVWDRETRIDDAADEVIDMLSPAPAAGDALAWYGLTDAERDGFVGELVDYGTDFVAPLYSVVESIEKRLREKNAAQQNNGGEA